MNEKLFPCKLSDKNTKLAEEAVELAVNTWGKKSLSELEAEELLSYSCEKVYYIWQELTLHITLHVHF